MLHWMSWVKLTGTQVWRGIAHAVGAVALVGLALALTPVASANASSFTWTGGSPGDTESAAHWSAAANWEGDTAPTTSQAIETLTFPRLTNGECTSVPESDTCYLTLNDISGLTVKSMQLDDADDYLLAGEGITLGSGGLTATPAAGASGFAGAFMVTPLELGASQKWSIAGRSGGEIEENGLLMEGELTGVSSALTIELSNGPALILANSTQVGPVTIEGPSATGSNIANGVVSLDEGELNSSNREPVVLSHVFFTGTGTVGALTANHATLKVGSHTESAGALEASSVKLDSGSGVLFEIMDSGTTARTDYSQLVSTGSVELAGPIVVVVGKPSSRAPARFSLRGRNTHLSPHPERYWARSPTRPKAAQKKYRSSLVKPVAIPHKRCGSATTGQVAQRRSQGRWKHRSRKGRKRKLKKEKRRKETP